MPERPAYLRIADEIRQKITSGVIEPGTRLPSNDELASSHSVSLMTVRKAMEVLKAEGLIESKTRGGTFARHRRPVRRISSERYLADIGPQDVPKSSYTSDQGITWSEYRLDVSYEWAEADEVLAELFGVEVGTRLLDRRFVFYSRGVPTQMSRPYLLASHVEGTPVADPGNEPWPGGTFAQLRSIGIVIDDITESVATRMPTQEEVGTLQISPGVPVFAITRRLLAQGRVVEVAHPIVIPGDSAILDYRIQI
ncbi:GntR family transcriptional regulator [Nonomuraea basaltis]|uniref:GntR family transcriptional regulator n=1 Tax=Nonomuraea basaltis TaxID=2495887 RepID=UPI00110C5EFE|nr:GntR family transcriptional regulator [Nonomuraea basaltis]TMR88189.1 GntR family transcriptional regulator [Nonomuraea basaltis]